MQFVTADVIELYPVLLHKEGLETKVREEPASKIF